MKTWHYILGSLTLMATVVWLALFALPDSKFHLIACDVGQGDAILAIYKNTQILMDGGPDNSVLDCLNRHVPFWDREIELVVLSHPQKDHYQGLIDVVQRYKVGNFLSDGLDSGNEGYKVLKKEVGSRGIGVIHSDRGMVLGLGLMRLEVLWPTHQFLQENGAGLVGTSNGSDLATFTSSLDPNSFSIITILSFGEFDALLTGDMGSEVSEAISQQLLANSQMLTIEYLKVPHHGSKNGLTQDLLEKVSPEVSVISAGRNNSYGHPHGEALKLLTDQGVKILRTDQDGEIEIISDGKGSWVSTERN